MKRRMTALLAAAAVFVLSGCSAFEKKYVVENDYTPIQQSTDKGESKVTVKTLSALKQAICELVYSGRTDGNISFDPDYDGEVSEDMASACWSLRTKDAFFAYCVDNIAYELSQIVNYTDASIHISYADIGIPVSDIVRMSYCTWDEDYIAEAYHRGTEKLVYFVLAGTYSDVRLERLMSDVYREHPLSAPVQPETEVTVYSGSGIQKLYEVRIDYRVSPGELAEFRRSTQLFAPFDSSVHKLDARQRLELAGKYIQDNCVYDRTAESSAYYALLGGRADSEGIALAMSELCRELELDCMVVYGQLNWEDHCWNIVNIDGTNYHVDMSAPDMSVFMLGDDTMWADYRWDIATYPPCAPAAQSE